LAVFVFWSVWLVLLSLLDFLVLLPKVRAREGANSGEAEWLQSVSDDGRVSRLARRVNLETNTYLERSRRSKKVRPEKVSTCSSFTENFSRGILGPMASFSMTNAAAYLSVGEFSARITLK